MDYKAARDMELHNHASLQPADESARTDHPVEWWFVQGRFAGEGVEPREFMVSLFRHALEWAGLSMGNACTFIASSLDPATGRNDITSLADEGTVPFLVKATRHYPPPGLDPTVVRIVSDELAECGPPQPVRVEAGKPRFTRKPFRVSWGAFDLAQEEDAFVLRFTEPGTGRRCCFRLVPEHPRFHLADVQMLDGAAMDYVSYTRLRLEGDVEGRRVTGEAWLDHQWGSQGWIVGGEKKQRILGWDWLGIQLDDRRELLVITHRDMGSGDALKQYAVEVARDGTAVLHHDVRMTPASWWTSPLTDARYPVRWHVSLPALEMELDFEPAADNQEIPMLPPFRAVWEGAGRVSGKCAGRSITGWARLELHGYGYITDLRRHLDGMMLRFQQHLEDFLPRKLGEEDIARLAGSSAAKFDTAAETAMLSAPLWDLMDRGVSRLWYSLPGLFIMGALGADTRRFEKLACITAEMVRAGAEIIDDIQDHALLRRGDEAIHLRHGLATAICAGNTAMFLPFALLSDYPGLGDTQRLDLYRILTRLWVNAHLGQAQDLHWTKVLTPERLHGPLPALEQHILQIYEGKSGALTSAALEGAAVIANADARTRAACTAFGNVLGLALQIVNDIANFSPARIRQGRGGSDLAEGKVTLVIARAVHGLRRHGRERLTGIFCNPALRSDPAALAEGVALVRDSGALQSCEATARTMLEKEWRRLSEVLPASEPKTMLRVLWSFVLSLCDEHEHAELVPA